MKIIIMIMVSFICNLALAEEFTYSSLNPAEVQLSKEDGIGARNHLIISLVANDGSFQLLRLRPHGNISMQDLETYFIAPYNNILDAAIALETTVTIVTSDNDPNRIAIMIDKK